jgi:hypothetical protein
MLYRAEIKHITAEDATALGNDIMLIAGELAGEQGDPAFYVKDAAIELEKRIGGRENLRAYVKCLHAGRTQKERA